MLTNFYGQIQSYYFVIDLEEAFNFARSTDVCNNVRVRMFSALDCMTFGEASDLSLY